MENLKSLNNNFVHSLKSRSLKIILIICLLLIPVLAILEFIDGDMINFFVEAVFEIPVLLSFILLIRGKYRGGSNLLVITAFVMMSLLSMIVKPTGPILFYRNSTYHLLAVSLSILFVEDFMITIVGAILMLLVQIIFGFFFLVPAGFEKGSVITMLIMAGAMYSLITFLLLEHTLVSIRQEKQLDSEQQTSQEQLSKISGIVKGASANFEAISNLSSQVTQIQELITNTVTSMNDIDNVAETIDSGANTTLTTTSQIGNNISTLTEHIAELVESQEQSEKSTAQMMETANNVAQSTETERNILYELSETSNQGKSKLSDLLANIKQVDESIASIFVKIEAIKKITTQTNLLAMNAAIEASHAGEAGKGFAVVAGEIRKLADNSSKNTDEINRLLDTVSENIVQVTEKSTLTSNAFNLIENNVHKSVSTIDQISTATNELVQQGKQVIQALDIVQNCSKEIQNGGASISGAHGELLETQNSLKESIAMLKNNTSLIKEKNESVLQSLNSIAKVSETGRIQAEELQRITQ